MCHANFRGVLFQVVATQPAPQATSNYPHPPHRLVGLPGTGTCKYPQSKITCLTTELGKIPSFEENMLYSLIINSTNIKKL